MDQITKEWAKSKGWHFNPAFDDDTLWLSHGDWHAAEEEDYLGRLSVYAGSEETEGNLGWEAHFWLSQLCGTGPGSIGLRWSIKRPSRKTALKRFVADYVVSMRILGFEHEEQKGTFFMPFSVDVAVLAQAIEDDVVEEAFEPLRIALDKAAEAKSVFDEMVSKSREVVG